MNEEPTNNITQESHTKIIKPLNKSWKSHAPQQLNYARVSCEIF